jgi:hypothetical protein
MKRGGATSALPFSDIFVEGEMKRIAAVAGRRPALEGVPSDATQAPAADAAAERAPQCAGGPFSPANQHGLHGGNGSHQEDEHGNDHRA